MKFKKKTRIFKQCDLNYVCQGTFGYICMYVITVANSVFLQLYLQHDFITYIFKNQT